MNAFIRRHDCRQELQALDLRATPARLAVLQFLEGTSQPSDVAMIVSFLKKNHIKADEATVFRIVHLFTERGITRQIQLNEGKFRYEYADQAEHHHFICETCGMIEDISDCNIDAIQKHIEKKKGLQVKRHSLEFFGLCKTCQSS